MFRQKVKISSLFTDELFTAKVREETATFYVRFLLQVAVFSISLAYVFILEYYPVVK